MPTMPVGSGMLKLKYGAATGLTVPSTWLILSAQPAYQTQRSMARSTALRAAAGSEAFCRGDLIDELRAAPFHQLRHAIENLAAVHRRLARPARNGAARRPDGVANVLARRAHGVGQRRAVGRRARDSCGPTRSAGTGRRRTACRSCARGCARRGRSARRRRCGATATRRHLALVAILPRLRPLEQQRVGRTVGSRPVDARVPAGTTNDVARRRRCYRRSRLPTRYGTCPTSPGRARPRRGDATETRPRASPGGSRSHRSRPPRSTGFHGSTISRGRSRDRNDAVSGGRHQWPPPRSSMRAGRAGRPRGRSRIPCSRRTATWDRSG